MQQIEDKRENGEGNDGYEPIGDSDSNRVYFFSIVCGSFDLGSRQLSLP